VKLGKAPRGGEVRKEGEITETAFLKIPVNLVWSKKEGEELWFPWGTRNELALNYQKKEMIGGIKHRQKKEKIVLGEWGGKKGRGWLRRTEYKLLHRNTKIGLLSRIENVEVGVNKE